MKYGKHICYGAVTGGQLRLLKHSYEENYPWNSLTLKTAIERGHLDCLKYLHENGCSCEGLYMWYIKGDVDINKQNEIRKYIREHDNLQRDNCKKCIKDKLWDHWDMNDIEYGSMIQWLPKETLEDALSLF